MWLRYEVFSTGFCRTPWQCITTTLHLKCQVSSNQLFMFGRLLRFNITRLHDVSTVWLWFFLCTHSLPSNLWVHVCSLRVMIQNVGLGTHKERYITIPPIPKTMSYRWLPQSEFIEDIISFNGDNDIVNLHIIMIYLIIQSKKTYQND